MALAGWSTLIALKAFLGVPTSDIVLEKAGSMDPRGVLLEKVPQDVVDRIMVSPKAYSCPHRSFVSIKLHNGYCYVMRAAGLSLCLTFLSFSQTLVREAEKEDLHKLLMESLPHHMANSITSEELDRLLDKKAVVLKKLAAMPGVKPRKGELADFSELFHKHHNPVCV